MSRSQITRTSDASDMSSATLARADVFASSAHRLRSHFGSRVLALYALKEDPYEPDAEDGEIIQLVALLKDRNPFEDSGPLAEINDALLGETGASVIIRGAAPGDELALLAQAEGVRL